MSAKSIDWSAKAAKDTCELRCIYTTFTGHIRKRCEAIGISDCDVTIGLAESKNGEPLTLGAWEKAPAIISERLVQTVVGTWNDLARMPPRKLDRLLKALHSKLHQSGKQVEKPK